MPEKLLLDRLDALALEVDGESAPVVAPHFLGERHNPAEFGSITGITLESFCGSIRREIERQFDLPLEIRSVREEAAVGAARLAVRSLRRK